MTGVSVGWFDPALFHIDPPKFADRVRKKMTPVLNKTWPLSVSSIRRMGFGTGVAYAIVDGHVPLHIDTKGLEDSDGRIWQFVVWTEHRPVLYVAKQTETLDPVMLEVADNAPAFSMGSIELFAGRAVHFDITTHWHGVGAMPMVGRSGTADFTPRAMIMQVSGYGPDQIQEALDLAGPLITADSSFWMSPRKHRVK